MSGLDFGLDVVHGWALALLPLAVLPLLRPLARAVPFSWTGLLSPDPLSRWIEHALRADRGACDPVARARRRRPAPARVRGRTNRARRAHGAAGRPKHQHGPAVRGQERRRRRRPRQAPVQGRGRARAALEVRGRTEQRPVRDGGVQHVPDSGASAHRPSRGGACVDRGRQRGARTRRDRHRRRSGAGARLLRGPAVHGRTHRRAGLRRRGRDQPDPEAAHRASNSATAGFAVLDLHTFRARSRDLRRGGVGRRRRHNAR